MDIYRVWPSAASFFGAGDYTFQLDNYPKLTANTTGNYFENQQIDLLPYDTLTGSKFVPQPDL